MNGSHVVIMTPCPIEGSGGIRSLFRFAEGLAKDGLRVELYTKEPFPGGDESLQIVAQRFYGDFSFALRSGPRVVGSPDLVIATSWDSVYLLKDLKSRAKAYLIQDLEHLFNPVGDGFLLGRNSYKFGFTPICLGRWLAQQVAKLSMCRVYSLPFGVDSGIYNTYASTQRRKQVCGIYQPEKPRRCGRMLLETLGIFKARHPDYEVIVYGNQQAAHTWFPALDFGIRSPDQLARLYAESQVGICLSTTNPSRIPFEMLACGLPVVDIYQDNNLFDLPENGTWLAESSPESLADAMSAAIQGRQERQRIMYDVSSDVEVASFVAAVHSILGDGEYGASNAAGATAVMEVEPRSVVRLSYRRRAIVSSVYRGYEHNAFTSSMVALHDELAERELGASVVLTPPQMRHVASESPSPTGVVVAADLDAAEVVSVEDQPALPNWLVERKDGYLQVHPIPDRTVVVDLPAGPRGKSGEQHFATAVVEYGHYHDDRVHADPAWFRFGFRATKRIDQKLLAALGLPLEENPNADPDVSLLRPLRDSGGDLFSDWIRLSPGDRRVTLFDCQTRPFTHIMIVTAVARGVAAKYAWAGISAIRCLPVLAS